MELTEKWLGEIGGWAAMKSARSLVDAGLATLQNAEGTLVRGLAGGGKMKFACGLRIRTRSDVDNLCTCPSARRGMICEHSLAVALLHIRGATGGKSPPPGTPRPPTAQPSHSAPQTPVPLAVPGRYTMHLPENLPTGGLRDGLSAYVKYEPGGEGESTLLAAWLAAQGIQGQSTPVAVRGELLDSMLTALAGHPRLICGKPSGGGIPMQAAREPVRLPLRVRAQTESEVTLHLPPSAGRALVATRPTGWWVCRETATLFPLPPASPEMAALLNALVSGTVRKPLLWLVAHRAELETLFQVELAGGVLESFHITPVPCVFEVTLEGSLQVLEARVNAEFQGKRWSVEEKPTRTAKDTLFPLQDTASKGLFYLPDEAGQRRVLLTLRALGFTPMQSTEGEFWRLSGAEKILAFYASELPRLRHEVKVVEGERWRTVTRGLARITPVLRPREDVQGQTSSGQGMDWLAMEFAYASPDGFRLPRTEVLRLVRSGQRSVQGPGGRRYVLDLHSVEEMEDTLRDVPVQISPEGVRIQALHAPYLLGEAASSAPKLPEEEELHTHIGDLAEKLRSYQMLGVRWMCALTRAGRGGVLGDDMGLGKTVQSIALIRALHSMESAPGPVLVVCPKSLTGNWRDEFTRFAPELTVAISQGTRREDLLKRLPEHDVIITTYQLVVRDLAALRAQPWRLVLLDEASHIRNPDTEAAKALRQLQARARLALTGTPVENSVRDLWSIYQFTLPGYLGSRENFKERFEQPLASGLHSPAAVAASERLRKLVRPYFLRRTKREVLKDLPEKIEQILWCEPSPAQAEVYRRVLEEGREEIKAARKRSGQGGAKMTMFTVLLRLRQACCDLRLTGLGGPALEGLSQDDLSGKWPMLDERLEEIFESGGKVLIFSQFVKYLHLVRAELERRDITFCYLDGSSQDREAQVKSFQSDPSRRVFLISLKAGGYGLNLTAADHVILLDPWWNPAVEAQAIDRAHRFGQQRVVTAARLAMRGTVEERILALQAKKRGLVEAALDDDSPLMSGLQEEDLAQLLEG